MNRKAERFVSKFADNCTSAKLSGWAMACDGNGGHIKKFGDGTLVLASLVAAIRSYMNDLPADEQGKFLNDFVKLVEQFDVEGEACV